jgi:exonuclease VII large subunit
LEKTTKEAEQRLAAKTAELKAQADQRVSEVEERMEAEKEEMMDAMAQEVDEIEKKKDAEKATLEKEKEDLQKRLTAALNSSKTVISGLGKVQNTAVSVVRGYKDTAVTVRRELDDMKASMKLLMSDTLVFKLRVSRPTRHTMAE